MSKNRRFTNSKPIEIRTSEEGGGNLFGHAAVFYDGTPQTEYELWSDARERIMPGAFDDVLGDDVCGLFNHDSSKLIGRTSSDTMSIGVDAVGLWFDAVLPKTQLADELREHVNRKDIRGCSFQFTVLEAIWFEEIRNGRSIDIRQVNKIARLYDVGPVTFPAYDATDISLRSIGDVSVEKKELDVMRQTRTKHAQRIIVLAASHRYKTC